MAAPSGRGPLAHHEPLEGLPRKVRIDGLGTITAAPHAQGRFAAAEHARLGGLAHSPPQRYARVDSARAGHIAAAYEDLNTGPLSGKSRSAYAALTAETLAQYLVAKKHGLRCEFLENGQDDPYRQSARLMTEDVQDNHHLWVVPSMPEESAVTADAAAIATNPLLEDSGESFGALPATYNDLFRAMHDYFGHAKEGLGFRTDGRENAWRSHAALYSPNARRAMTTETRGINSWLYYGPRGKDHIEGTKPGTMFPPHKVGLLPEWVMREGMGDHEIASPPMPTPATKALEALATLRLPMQKMLSAYHGGPWVMTKNAEFESKHKRGGRKNPGQFSKQVSSKHTDPKTKEDKEAINNDITSFYKKVRDHIDGKDSAWKGHGEGSHPLNDKDIKDWLAKPPLEKIHGGTPKHVDQRIEKVRSKVQAAVDKMGASPKHKEAWGKYRKSMALRIQQIEAGDSPMSMSAVHDVMSDLIKGKKQFRFSELDNILKDDQARQMAQVDAAQKYVKRGMDLYRTGTPSKDTKYFDKDTFQAAVQVMGRANVQINAHAAKHGKPSAPNKAPAPAPNKAPAPAPNKAPAPAPKPAPAPAPTPSKNFDKKEIERQILGINDPGIRENVAMRAHYGLKDSPPKPAPNKAPAGKPAGKGPIRQFVGSLLKNRGKITTSNYAEIPASVSDSVKKIASAVGRSLSRTLKGAGLHKSWRGLMTHEGAAHPMSLMKASHGVKPKWVGSINAKKSSVNKKTGKISLTDSLWRAYQVHSIATLAHRFAKTRTIKEHQVDPFTKIMSRLKESHKHFRESDKDYGLEKGFDEVVMAAAVIIVPSWLDAPRQKMLSAYDAAAPSGAGSLLKALAKRLDSSTKKASKKSTKKAPLPLPSVGPEGKDPNAKTKKPGVGSRWDSAAVAHYRQHPEDYNKANWPKNHDDYHPGTHDTDRENPGHPAHPDHPGHKAYNDLHPHAKAGAPEGKGGQFISTDEGGGTGAGPTIDPKKGSPKDTGDTGSTEDDLEDDGSEEDDEPEDDEPEEDELEEDEEDAPKPLPKETKGKKKDKEKSPEEVAALVAAATASKAAAVDAENKLKKAMKSEDKGLISEAKRGVVTARTSTPKN
ncbi:MAG: hypothetical protein NT142_17270 [Planctomycetota bacterium]|nr:hypothetical protein [Planctomycetota bacterium]